MNYYGNPLPPPYSHSQPPRPILPPQPNDYSYPPPFPPQDMNVPPPLPPVNPNFLQQPPPHLIPPRPFQPWYPPRNISTAPYYPPQQTHYHSIHGTHSTPPVQPKQHYVPERSSFPSIISSDRPKIQRMRSNKIPTEKKSPVPEPVSLTAEEIIENERKTWTRCAPADLFYVRDENNPRLMKGTDKLQTVIKEFENQLINRGKVARERQPKLAEAVVRKSRNHGSRCGASCHNNKSKNNSDNSDHSHSESSSEDEDDEIDLVLEELERKKKHPARLHPELWYNDPGEMNDGPLCRCSLKARKTGIRHGIYAGESTSRICQLNSNNADLLHHYRVTISPPTNFLLKRPTVIHHDEHEFIFEGFSLMSHYQLDQLPTCKVSFINICY